MVGIDTMASIRRSLSPYHDRHNQNGASPFAESSPQLRHGKSSSEGLRRILVSALMGKYPKKSPASWKRSITRCLLFFLCGFLLGMTPFGPVNDLQANEFSFEFKSNHDNAQSKLSTDRPIKRFDVFANANITHSVQLHEALVELNPEEWGLTARKQLIVVTPTYNRAFQAYFLNRVSQVLRLVQPPLLWIVVEMNGASMETAEILRKSKVLYRHLVCNKNMSNVKDRGVHQRNTALEHIQLHQLDGIVYFADDDNIYSLELFENMRRIRRFGTWPVAMVAPSKSKAILEGPVCNRSQVIGWHTNEKSKRLRRFHVDMSGFAFNSTILWDPKRWRRPIPDPIRQLDSIKEGFQETTFIEQVVEDESQMEATSPSCSTIMNWHLHLGAHNVFYPKGWQLEKNLDPIVS